MSTYRNRLSRLQRKAATTPSPPGAVHDAQERARRRLLARLKQAAGEKLTAAERALLADEDQSASDLETHRRNLRAAGIDPDRDADERRARLRARIRRDAG